MEQRPVCDADSVLKEQVCPEVEALWDLANRICDRHGLNGTGQRSEQGCPCEGVVYDYEVRESGM